MTFVVSVIDRGGIVLFMSRCLIVKFQNHYPENDKIDNEIKDTYRNDMQPAGFGIALENAEQEEIQETAGKCHTDTNIQHMHEHIGEAGKCTVNDI